ncbi:MAG: hypothetical protein ACTSUE_09440 [Promethearchaeota archaeon]
MAGMSTFRIQLNKDDVVDAVEMSVDMMNPSCTLNQGIDIKYTRDTNNR